jgi:hypothetical protein
VGVLKAWFRSLPALDGFQRQVTGQAVAKIRELEPKACFDKFGVGGCQRIFGGQAPMGPAGGFVGGLKGMEFRDQPISQDR